MRVGCLWTLLTRLAWTAISVQAGEFDPGWPQFLGPNRNGVAASQGLATHWAKDGPRVCWKREVGSGLSGPVVQGDHVILFDRGGGNERVAALERSSGKEVWSQVYPTRFSPQIGDESGPLATPVLAQGFVVTMSPNGTVVARDSGTGAERWRVDTQQSFGARPGFFGLASSPLVVGQTVICCVGGTGGAAVVALAIRTGALLWKSVEDEAGYASPVPATLEGLPSVVAFLRTGLVVLDPATGKVRHQLRWRSREHASVNAATPLVSNSAVFLTASYGTGAVWLDLAQQKLVPRWQGDEHLSSHYATPVLVGEFLYGLHGRTDFPPGPSLRCVDKVTGRTRWEVEGFGAASLLAADGTLVILRESGLLVLAPASPDGFKPSAEAQVLGSGSRALPALAGGRLYARDRRQLLCLELREVP